MSTQSKVAAATTKVVTGKCRLSYAHVWTPHSSLPGQEPKYSVLLLIPKSDATTQEKIMGGIKVATENGKGLWGGKIPPNLKHPLRDGDQERADDPLYQGHWFMNASSKEQPGIVDRHLNKVLDRDEVYSGCYAAVSVNFYPYNVNGNRGVACGLNNIQKLADGSRLSGRSAPETDFTAQTEDFLQ